ncbi:hypothetical protein [Streptomyces sp. NPDC057854]|uniref:hypothetical protein n=1 Tax=unclassified Streptomyces TaxID=2593676 RepID=UPI0036AA3630
MTVMVDAAGSTRERVAIPLRMFGFWAEHREHPVFRVSILERGSDVPVVRVIRGFGNAVVYVRAFAECVGMAGQATVVMASIYRTGYASVAGNNIRVCPIA